jgi:alcohol dehydrogenase class IV
MSVSADWSYPTSIRFGAGRVRELADACKQARITRPLFVTNKGLTDLDIGKRALAILEEAGLPYTVCAEVETNPTDTDLDAGLRAYWAGNHDGVVAFGGGSGIDLGKLIAFMSGQILSVFVFEDGGERWKRADTDTIAPIIAVPTAAGTGAEVTRAGALIDSDSHVKRSIAHPKMMPTIVISDPELTIGLPEQITVGTGMDAFAHCLEAYCSPNYHPMSHGIALEGLRLVKENLPRVVKNPDDIEARGQMMSAAAMGAVSLQKSLGAIHALTHPVNALYNTHHGMTNAVVMPVVLAFNRPEIENKIEMAAAYLGIDGGFDGFYDFLMAFRHDLGVPDKLSGLGVGAERIDELAQMAVEDPTAAGNPRKLTIEDARELYASCL